MSKYRKSWTQALQEVFNNLDKVVEEAEIDEWVIEESAGLQLKMAFDDAKIKIKGVKGGKLVIDKKDKKKVEDVISKQMKKPADAKRVLGSQIVFEENPYMIKVTKDFKYDGKVVKISKKDFSKVHKDFKNSTKGKERMLINDPKTGGSISVPVQFEEIEEKVAVDKPNIVVQYIKKQKETSIIRKEKDRE